MKNNLRRVQKRLFFPEKQHSIKDSLDAQPMARNG